MSTYTSSLGLEQITPGDQAGLWGNTTNNNLALIDQAVTGVTPISFAALSGQTYTLTDFDGAVDEARSAVLNITGIASGANTIVIPNKQKTYLVRNNTGQNVVFRTPTPTTTYTVGAGNSILIFCNGNNEVFTGIASPSVGTLGVAGGGTGATTFTAGFIKSTGGTNALTSASSVNLNSAEVSGVLSVTNGGTGAGTFTAGSLLVGNGAGNFGTLVGGGVGQVATWNGTTWTAQTPTTSAVTSVFGRNGAVTALSSDYSSFYYPLSSNPAGYVTSGSLAGYAQLSASQTWTGANSFSTSGSILMSASNGGDQRIQVSGSGYSSGIAPTAVQIGLPTHGVIYSPGISAVEILLPAYIASFRAAGAFQSNNSPNWATTSDINIKTNLRPINNALGKLTSLNPCHFEYKDEIGKTRSGFIAQEFETVFPGHTTETGVPEKYKEFLPEGVDKLKSLDLNLIPYLVKAIQELKAELDEAKAEIAALKAQ